MSFFEKYAKLKSDVQDNGSGFTVVVYDDEVSMEKPAMWLEGEVRDIREFGEYFLENYGYNFESGEEEDFESLIDYYEGKYDYVISVPIVNTDSSIYFEMPENRRNSCATALFKRFIKFYRETFEDQLVFADFANYDLQEKFKVACEKGIFPKDSLDIVQTTSKSSYDKSPHYNIDNREYTYGIQKNIVELSQNAGIEAYIENENIFIKNTPVSTISSNVEQIINDVANNIEDRDIKLPFRLEFKEQMPGYYDNGEVTFAFPLGGRVTSRPSFMYTFSNKELDLLSNDLIAEDIKLNEESFRNIFDEVQTIKTTNGSFTVEEFFGEQTQTASRKNMRLKKGWR